jgi:signal transduction histidine kinase
MPSAARRCLLAAELPPPPVPSELAQSRVVVVDDNLPSLQLVQLLLARSGFRAVRAVSDPRDLIARYDELQPELVVLDLHMPGMDGYTALSALRARATAADLPVLVLTADATRSATHRALELGANDFLTKPLDATELMLRVRNLLQTRALHVGLRRRHRWLEASGRLAADLLADICPEPLRRVSELAREAAGADAAVVVLPSVGQRDAPAMSAHVWVGAHAGAAAAAVADAFQNRVLPADTPQLIEDVGGDQRDRYSVGPAMLVPLRGADRHLGALLLCRRRGAAQFTPIELELACGFAGQAVVAVEFAQARTDQERMMILSDRHRIARDLHDQVIQRLFATGLRLQQIAQRMGPGPESERIDERVDELDETIEEIRSTIFGLRQELVAEPGRLARELNDLVGELTDVLGFPPRVFLAEPLDAVPDDVAEDLVAAAREALTNVAKHAGATRVAVDVSFEETDVVLEVADNGVGFADPERRSGLVNLSERALRHGGRCSVRRAPDGGTELVWTASLFGEQPAPAESADASTADRDDADGSVDDELIRSGVVTRQARGRHTLDLDGDV